MTYEMQSHQRSRDMHIRRKTLVAGALIGLAAGAAAVAQEAALSLDAAAPSPGPSPFEFAQSGAKAKAMEEAASDDSAGRVIGGVEAAPGAWPWQVALVDASRPVSPESQFCGGSMVLDNWVLTAAHCVRWPTDTPGETVDLAPGVFDIVVGTNVLGEGGDKVPVEAVFIHPDYRHDVFDYDVALVKLARTPTADYKTIQIPDEQFGDILDQPGIRTIVTGWGLTNGQQRPAAMREAEIQLLDRNQCNGVAMQNRAGIAARAFMQAVDVFDIPDDGAQTAWEALVQQAPPALSERQLCSGTFEGGKTSCSGDSGGPLVTPLEDGTYIQIGVVSWGMSSSDGTGCYEEALFSVYTRAVAFLPWLEQTIGAN
ncbi:serine protease [Rhodobacteraceae bacterium CCMM004]|nr:serine protease [Rhodobacteraceae bacterium CCMM004]